MKAITWDQAVSVLDKWAANKVDVHFAKVGDGHPERKPIEANHGEAMRIVSASLEEGSIELEVRGKPVPVDLRGATIQYGDEGVNPSDEELLDAHSGVLEFTFPEGERWIFDEAPIDI